MSRMLPDASPVALTEFGLGGAPPAGPAEANANALKVMHRLLRGRYLVTVLLAGVGAAAGAVGGYLATSPKYETIGTISVSAVQPTIMADRESPVPMFASFVNQQAAMLRNLRVLAAAMGSPEWKAAGFGNSPADEAELRRCLIIEAPRESQLINVRCVAKDSVYTKVAVQQVIAAYEKLYASTIDSPEGRIALLKAQRTARSREIDTASEAIRDTANEARKGTDDLTLVHSTLLDQVTALDGRLRDLQLQLVEAGVNPEAPLPAPDDAIAPQPAAPPPNIVIAATDEHMAGLLSQESELVSRLKALETKGLLSEHQSVRDVNSRLAGVQKAIDARRTAWWEAQRAMPVGSVAPGAETVEQKKARYRALQQSRDDAFKELERIDGLKARIESLREQRAELIADRENIQKRLNILEAEAAAQPVIGGRITVLSRGDTPGSPTVDKRTQLAAVGFVAGAGAPVALMLLLGLLDRRFRYSDQTEDLGPAPTMLGVLPVLPQRLDDAEQRAIAAHCVHQVRLLLQIGGQHSGRKVYTITSPTAGDGKTSLALSLGLSFSAAGARTLLIDFDMIGTGLTSSLRLLNGHASVSDALVRGRIDPADLPMASDRLWVLPSRADDDHLVSRLSTVTVKRLLDAARAAFDVVLIDTGPVLGSLEASLVSAESDGVIVVVGRGQRRDHIQQAFARVAAVGGRLIGMVFNRATPGDFKRSVSSTSMRSVPRALALPAGAPRPETDRLGDAGPIVRTVALELDAESQSERARAS